MKTSYSSGPHRATVDSMMTPMIDVVFLLLIFFLSTSSFQKPENSLPSSVASSPKDAQQGDAPGKDPQEVLTDLSDVVIRIQATTSTSGEKTIGYSINGESIESFMSLSRRLANLVNVRADVPLIIDPEDNVPAGEAIRVYDSARAAGSVAVFLVAR